MCLIQTSHDQYCLNGWEVGIISVVETAIFSCQPPQTPFFFRKCKPNLECEHYSAPNQVLKTPMLPTFFRGALFSSPLKMLACSYSFIYNLHLIFFRSSQAINLKGNNVLCNDLGIVIKVQVCSKDPKPELRFPSSHLLGAYSGILHFVVQKARILSL